MQDSASPTPTPPMLAKAPSLANLDAMILAGGLGTRLSQVVTDRPKVMVEINGHPFLEYLFHQLLKVGVSRAILCTGYKANQIESHFGTKYKDLQIIYSEESAPLGTAGALRFGLAHTSSENLLILNGDTFCLADLTSFYSWHLSKNSRASIYLTKVSDTGRYGRVELSEEGRILKFSEKQTSGGAGYINGGIYLLSRSLLSTIPEGKQVSIEKEIFPKLIGDAFWGYKSKSNIFIDIGTPESLVEAKNVLPPI